MSFKFSCNHCGETRERDLVTPADWFTLAVDEGSGSIRIYRWPTGCRLREPLYFLLHACSPAHTAILATKWINRETL